MQLFAFAETAEATEADAECVDDLTTEANECEAKGDDEPILAYLDDLQADDLRPYLVWVLELLFFLQLRAHQVLALLQLTGL